MGTERSAVAGHGVCDWWRDVVGRWARTGVEVCAGSVERPARPIQGRLPVGSTHQGDSLTSSTICSYIYCSPDRWWLAPTI